MKFWLDFMRRERELLLSAPIYAESPQTLYPQVRAINGRRGIFACYQRDCAVELPASELDECIIVNACASSDVILRSDAFAKWDVLVRDCTGEEVRHERMELCKLDSIAIPECGMAELHRIN